jgi:serine/threonine protein phosphatase PrpC
MQVHFLIEKGSGPLNEDNLVITQNIFGVFDGVTSLDNYRDPHGNTGGLLASRIAKNVFEKGNKPLVDLALEANSLLREEMLKNGVDLSKKVNLWGTTAAVIQVNQDTFDWIQIGDSQILVLYDGNSYKPLVDNYDHDRETLILWKELADKKIKNIREILVEPLKKAREKANVSYGVLNGEREMIRFLNQGKENLGKVKHILIFTDGLLIPQENPRNKDPFSQLVKLFLEGGLERIRDYVREREKSDPECWKYPRFKPHDDMAAISISF